jgi:hypothetical protein
MRNRRVRSLVRAAELSMAVPQVMAARTAQMLAARGSPNAALRKETLRMSSEKVQAFWESAWAMGWQALQSQQALTLLAMRRWLALWGSAWSFPFAPFMPFSRLRMDRAIGRNVEKVLERGMLPVHRLATANARRLGRLKRS